MNLVGRHPNESRWLPPEFEDGGFRGMNLAAEGDSADWNPTPESPTPQATATSHNPGGYRDRSTEREKGCMMPSGASTMFSSIGGVTASGIVTMSSSRCMMPSGASTMFSSVGGMAASGTGTMYSSRMASSTGR